MVKKLKGARGSTLMALGKVAIFEIQSQGVTDAELEAIVNDYHEKNHIAGKGYRVTCTCDMLLLMILQSAAVVKDDKGKPKK